MKYGRTSRMNLISPPSSRTFFFSCRLKKQSYSLFTCLTGWRSRDCVPLLFRSTHANRSSRSIPGPFSHFSNYWSSSWHRKRVGSLLRFEKTHLLENLKTTFCRKAGRRCRGYCPWNARWCQIASPLPQVALPWQDRSTRHLICSNFKFSQLKCHRADGLTLSHWPLAW